MLYSLFCNISHSLVIRQFRIKGTCANNMHRKFQSSSKSKHQTSSWHLQFCRDICDFMSVIRPGRYKFSKNTNTFVKGLNCICFLFRIPSTEFLLIYGYRDELSIFRWIGFALSQVIPAVSQTLRTSRHPVPSHPAPSAPLPLLVASDSGTASEGAQHRHFLSPNSKSTTNAARSSSITNIKKTGTVLTTPRESGTGIEWRCEKRCSHVTPNRLNRAAE